MGIVSPGSYFATRSAQKGALASRFCPTFIPASEPLASTPLQMAAMTPPLRSVFHILCRVPALSESLATRATATRTLSQVAPHNRHWGRPTNTPKGFLNVSHHTFTGVPVVNSLFLLPRQNPWVIPGYPRPKRYRPYPRPQILSSGDHPVVSKGKKRRRRRCGPRPRPVNPGLSGGVVWSLIPTSHPRSGIAGAGSTLLIADYDVEMDEATYVPEVPGVQLVDVEMVDDFLPGVPTTVASVRCAWS